MLFRPRGASKAELSSASKPHSDYLPEKSFVIKTVYLGCIIYSISNFFTDKTFSGKWSECDENTYLHKPGFSDREKLLKFVAEGREFANFLK